MTAFDRQPGAAAVMTEDREESTAEAVCFMLPVDRQTFWKCPFFPHDLHIASLAGHLYRGCRGNPQKKQVSFVNARVFFSGKASGIPLVTQLDSVDAPQGADMSE